MGSLRQLQHSGITKFEATKWQKTMADLRYFDCLILQLNNRIAFVEFTG